LLGGGCLVFGLLDWVGMDMYGTVLYGKRKKKEARREKEGLFRIENA